MEVSASRHVAFISRLPKMRDIWYDGSLLPNECSKLFINIFLYFFKTAY